MCLGNVDSGLTDELKSSKKAWIRVWKVVARSPKTWRAPIQGIGYGNVAHNTGKFRFGRDAVHAFGDLKGARIYAHSSEFIIEAYVRPKWIIAAGYYMGHETISAEHMILPLYPRKKLSARRVREIAQQYDI